MMIHIDEKRCRACGICGDVCPRHIPVTAGQAGDKRTRISEERIGLCMSCGHCMAVCPNSAIEVETLADQAFDGVAPLRTTSDDLLQLMKQRRSVRNYKKKSFSGEALAQILEAVKCSPTGTSGSTNGVILLDDPEKLKRFSDLCYKSYQSLDRALKNPIGRFIVRQRAGKRITKTLQEFVMPGMQWYIKWYQEGKSNEIIRDCAALMLFHSPVTIPMAAENSLIAAFHAILMAETLGIGTCFNDLIPPICHREPDIKRLIGLPDGHEVFASITMGYPKYKFLRTIPRQLASVTTV
ncbi:nitroreductase family protein [bacterium]|nr:nitroreductase family protein [bacterium]